MDRADPARADCSLTPPSPRSQGAQSDSQSVPRCGVCLDSLGSNGGPASLPCGHNGCLDCLNQVLGADERSPQRQLQPQCPFCRQAYTESLPLGQNRELKEALDALEEARNTVVSVQQELAEQQEQQHKLLTQNQQLILQHHHQQKLPMMGSPSKEGMYPPVHGAHQVSQAAGGTSSGSSGQYQTQGQQDGALRRGTDVPEGGRSRGRGVLRGVLSLVKGKSRSRDQFWNTAAAAASSSGSEGCGSPEEGHHRDQASPEGPALTAGGSILAPPSAPPITFSADPHYLTGISAVDRFLQEGGWVRRVEGSGEESLTPVQRVLEAEPPTWVPDSASPTCMRCSNLFRPLICMRHHCRFCGHLVCDACSRGRALLPKYFRESEPQRVCDGCFEVLLPVQRMLVATVAPAVQVALHDVTDWSSVRAWVNNPWGNSMQDEIFKATNTLRSYAKVGTLNPEKAIPGVVLGGARGLAVLTTVKAGAGVSYKLGSGLVLSRRPDGSWSAPTAIATAGFAWGAQIGGEIVDLIVVLRSVEALKAFCGDYHLAVGASLGAAAGPVGRIVEADVRAGRQGLSTAYTYSCAKGAYVGISWEYSLIAACHNANMRFYGSRDCRPADILFGNFPQPLAAKPLYAALDDLFRTVEDQQLQLQRSQQERSLSRQQEARFEAGDAMAAAEAVAIAASAPVYRFFAESGEGEQENISGSASRRTEYQPQQQSQGQSHADEAVLGPPPPPYDACYPESSSVDSAGTASDWPSGGLSMMFTA